jgi:phenylalanyl-tRNA synthetase alpha chain
MAYAVPKLEDYSEGALARAKEDLLRAFSDEEDDLVGTAKSPDIQRLEKGNRFRQFRDRWFARKNGILTQINEYWLKNAPPVHKREVGQAVNEIRTHTTQRIEDLEKTIVMFSKFLPETLRGMANRGTALDAAAVSESHLESDRLDVALPGIRRPLGAEHPVLRTMNEIVGVFRAMGYSVADGPEIETDYYNFEALNFPPNHPARDTQDTIFVAGQEKKAQRDRLLLRTHTSPVQIRAMLATPPPIRVVVPGKVHRADTADATHSPIFHQVEGLAVDTNITFCDLKGTLDHAMKALFGSNVKTRFYPSFFPFTEPSADVQVTCFKCGGKGCRLCKMSGWIELLGCGMVDPNVFSFVESNGYDARKISGFAFGMGVERITMLKYGIDDIQLFYQGDVRFLEQFA